MNRDCGINIDGSCACDEPVMPPDDALMAEWFGELAAGWNEIARRYAALPSSTRASMERTGLSPRSAIGRVIRESYLPDAHTVRFSEMSAEAEAELAAWDEMLHGRTKP